MITNILSLSIALVTVIGGIIQTVLNYKKDLREKQIEILFNRKIQAFSEFAEAYGTGDQVAMRSSATKAMLFANEKCRQKIPSYCASVNRNEIERITQFTKIIELMSTELADEAKSLGLKAPKHISDNKTCKTEGDLKK